MLSRSVQVCLTIALVVASVASFVFFARFDESGIQGASRVLLVTAGEGNHAGGDTLAMIADTAEREGAVVGRYLPDLHDPEGRRHFYLTVGDPTSEAAGWLEQGYPAFTPTVTTSVHPWQDQGRLDARGDYLVFGPVAAADALVAELRAAGYTVATREAYELSSVVNYTLTDPVSASVLATAVLVATVAAAGAVAATKAYGVRRLQGASWARMVGADLLAQLRYLVPATLACLVVVVVALRLVNEWNQLGRFLAIAAGTAAFLVAATTLGHILGVTLAHHTRLTAALKGEISSLGILVSGYMIRGLATMLALGLLATAVSAWGSLDGFERTRPVWQSGNDAVRLSFDPTFGAEGTDLLAVCTGEWLMAEERAGALVLAADNVLALQLGPEWLGTPSLLANGNYLREQPHLDAQGQVITGPGEDQVLVILPERLAAQADSIRAGLQEWAAAQHSRFGSGAAPELGIVTVPNGQLSYTYASQTPGHPPVLTDAVLVVADQRSGLLSPDAYMSTASQGGAVLMGAADAQSSAEAAGLGDFILSYAPASLTAASLHAEAARTWRISLFNLGTALAVVAAAVLGVALVYTRRERQRLFVTHISGWSFVRTHAVILAVESLILAGIAAGQARAVAAGAPAAGQSLTIEALAAQESDRWLPFLALTVAFAASGLMVVGTATLTRRLIHHRSAED